MCVGKYVHVCVFARRRVPAARIPRLLRAALLELCVPLAAAHPSERDGRGKADMSMSMYMYMSMYMCMCMCMSMCMSNA